MYIAKLIFLIYKKLMQITKKRNNFLKQQGILQKNINDKKLYANNISSQQWKKYKL